MPDKVSAKSFLAEVVDRFIKSDKVDANMHFSKLINMRYNGKKHKGVHYENDQSCF